MTKATIYLVLADDSGTYEPHRRELDGSIPLVLDLHEADMIVAAYDAHVAAQNLINERIWDDPVF